MSRPKYSVGRQFGWIATARVLAALLQAALMIMLAREVTPTDFGVLAAVLAVIVVAQSVLDFGLPTFAVREWAASRGSGAAIVALRLNVWTSFGLGVVLAFGILLSGEIFDDPLVYLPLIVSAAGERIADARLSIAVADGDAYHNAVGLVGRRTVAIVAFTLLILFQPGSATLWYAVAVAVAAIGSALYASIVTRDRLKETGPTPDPRPVFIASRAYWANSMAAQLRNLDAPLVVAFGTALQGGFYAIAGRLTVPLRIPATSLGTAILPAAARVRVRSELAPLLRLVVRASAGLTVIYLLGALLVPWLVPLLLGHNYAAAVAPIVTMVLGLPFASVSSMLSALLQGLNQKVKVASIAGITTAVCLIGVMVGAALGGAFAAAVALSISFVIQAALLCGVVVSVRRGMEDDDEAKRA